MIVTCPNCETQFELDDQHYVPGRKARCSVCSFMFILPAPVEAAENAPEENTTSEFDEFLAASEQEEAEAAANLGKSNLPDELSEDKDWDAEKNYTDSSGGPEKKKKSGLKRFIIFLGLLLCLAGLAAGAYLVCFQGKIELPFLSSEDAKTGTDPVAQRIADLDKVRDLLLIDVSHKYIQNVKLGPLVVITGKVKNNFSTPKEMIRVEASLLDKSGKVLATQQQYCGIELPDLQLQVMGQKELAQALDNRFDILARNINVQSGSEVPFTVVFVYPPSNMAEYTVIVADVANPPDLTPQGQNAQ